MSSLGSAQVPSAGAALRLRRRPACRAARQGMPELVSNFGLRSAVRARVAETTLSSHSALRSAIALMSDTSARRVPGRRAPGDWGKAPWGHNWQLAKLSSAGKQDARNRLGWHHQQAFRELDADGCLHVTQQGEERNAARAAANPPGIRDSSSETGPSW